MLLVLLVLVLLRWEERLLAGPRISRSVPAVILVAVLAYSSAKIIFVSPQQHRAARQVVKELSGREVCAEVEGERLHRQLYATHLILRFIHPELGQFRALVQFPIDYFPQGIPLRDRVLCFRARLKTVHRSRNGMPPIASYAGRLWRAGIAIQGKAIAMRKQVEGEYTWSDALLSRVLQEYEGSFSPGMLGAALLGRKDLLAEPVWRVFQELGISHLLVISGFHFAALAGLTGVILTRLLLQSTYILRRTHVRHTARYASLILAWSYFCILPYATPVFRAVVACTLLVLTFSRSRAIPPWRSLAVVAIVVLLAEPATLVDVGPQLTFAALLGIYWGLSIAECMSKSSSRYFVILPGVSGPLHSFFTASIVSLAASIMTMPLVLSYFQLYSPLAPIISMIVSPVFSVVVLFGGSIVFFLSACGLPLAELLWSPLIAAIDALLVGLFTIAGWSERSGLGVRFFSESGYVVRFVWLVYLPLIVGILWTQHKKAAYSDT